MRPSPWTPTDRTSASSTTGHCQIVAVEAGRRSAPRGRSASAARSTSSRSAVTSPTMRMPRPGPGERLAPDDALGHAELEADLAHLVLEQRAQRLDQLELQVVGQAADVVVRLDVGRAGAAAGLDDVGVERALDEELDRVALGVGASPTTSRAACSKTRMNSRPMILRFSSGSVTPASAARNRSRASTTTRSTPVAATKSFSTCSASPSRSSPWSTNTQVSWSPTALCTSAAATDESTPPDSAQSTRRLADLRADRGDQVVDDVGGGPVGRRARRRAAGSSRAPAGRRSSACTSGCHCTP